MYTNKHKYSHSYKAIIRTTDKQTKCWKQKKKSGTISLVVIYHNIFQVCEYNDKHLHRYIFVEPA